MNEDQSETDKDQLMTHFQEITNFYDMEQCQAILESTNWNLDQAVQSFFNGDTVVQNLEEEPIDSSDIMPSAPHIGADILTSSFSVENIFSRQNLGLNSASTQFNDSNDLYASGTSINPPIGFGFMGYNKPSNRLINFKIEYFKHKFDLHMPDSETVLALKELISDEINLPVENQKLKGWKNKDAKISDEMLLRQLNLPLDNNLFVINTNTNQTDNVIIERSSNDIDLFELVVRIVQTQKKQLTIINNSESVEAADLVDHFNQTFKTSNSLPTQYRLQFDSNVKFIEIKRKVYTLSNMNINEQEWWLYLNPEINQEETCLEQLIESGHLFNMPLNVLIENDLTLLEISSLLDKLTESNTKIATSASVPMISTSSLSLATSQTNLFNPANSKLTPQNKSNICKIGFLVTSKKSFQDDNTSIGSACTSRFKMNTDTNDLQQMNEDITEEDESHDMEVYEEEEDLDDNFMLDTAPKNVPLIAATCPAGDEFAGTRMFVEEFFKRYQPLIPIFSIGTLEDAIKDALLCPARDRKLLGMYLHSDNSLSKHIFCSKTLCDENVINFLNANFVVWPWDLTNKPHEAHFYATCSKYLGSVVTSHLKTNKIEFPAFLIVNRTRGTNEVIAVIEGTASNETMMHRLMQAYEMFEAQRIHDERSEQTRDEREQIKREQDAAYQASLQLDKAKKQKQDEENQRIKKVAESEQMKEILKIQTRQKLIKDCLDQLEPEPADDIPLNKITKIRFRLPDGQLLQRKFYIQNKLKEVLNFLTASGYFSEEFKVLSSWPRRDLTTESIDRTIEDLKLYPQETLTLEER